MPPSDIGAYERQDLVVDGGDKLVVVEHARRMKSDGDY